MTRKVRCGNTQKHTKMPEDATPWEELSRDVKANAQSRINCPGKNIKTEKMVDSIEKSTEDVDAKETQQESPVTEEVQSKRSKKKFKKTEKADLTEDLLVQAESTSADNADEIIQENPQEEKKLNKFMKKDKINKKKIFQQKLLQRRLENGVTLLAPNQERKLYLLKKKLREKGYPPEMIKQIARKKRREEEIKFRKTFTTKICFHCRERGHLLSNCPQRLGETKQVTGVCFKCGSTEHVSYRCQKRVDGYPLAKCFICKEQGHISKECPKNQRGVYIKGGACRECGNVNHLQKDCPLLVKKNVDPSISLYTIQDGTSIDAEIVDDEPIRKKKAKKPKVVKF